MVQISIAIIAMLVNWQQSMTIRLQGASADRSGLNYIIFFLLFRVGTEGLEPPAFSVETRHSDPLSYVPVRYIPLLTGVHLVSKAGDFGVIIAKAFVCCSISRWWSHWCP